MVTRHKISITSLILSAVWDDLFSDISYDSRISIWSDTLPKRSVDKMDKIRLKLIVLVQI